MGSDWSLGALMDNDKDLLKIINTIHDANYHPGMMRVGLSILYEFTQDSEFDCPYYRVYTHDGEYVFAGWLVYSPDYNLWEFQGAGDWPISTEELRTIADKIDELNTQLIKERTWLDRLFNM